MAETKRTEIVQHIGWLKIYAAAMSPDNWRDMKDRIERQLRELSEAVRTAFELDSLP